PPLISTLFPYTTLFRSVAFDAALFEDEGLAALRALRIQAFPEQLRGIAGFLLELDVRLDRAVRLVVRLDGRLHAGLLHPDVPLEDRKSTRLNSSHRTIS